MPKNRFPELCKIETLKIAINYVFDDQKDDFIPDIFRHQDYLFILAPRLIKSRRPQM